MPDYRAMATQAAQKYGVPVNVFLAQINQESGFNPTAQSGAGAQGIAQFMPATAKSYGVNPLDPVSALDGAARYDRDLLKKYGSVQSMLSAYNSGKPNTYTDPNFAKGQTYNYVKNIMAKAGTPQQKTAPTGESPVSQNPSFSPGLDPSGQQRQLVVNYLLQAAQNGGQTSTSGLMSLVQQRANLNAAAGNGGSLALSGAAGAQGATGGQQGGTYTSNDITKVTHKFLGVPYVWGGNDPQKALDCSSFVQQAFKQMGVPLPRTTYAQFKLGQPVDLKNLKPGDAVFTNPEKSGPGHVGIYIGNGQVQESPHTGDVNKIIALHDYLGGGFVGARRYI